MADSQPLVVILDDRELNQPVEAEELKKRGKEVVEAEEPEEVDEDVDALIEWPSWLPDGWDIDVRRGDNGSTYRVLTLPHTLVRLYVYGVFGVCMLIWG